MAAAVVESPDVSEEQSEDVERKSRTSNQRPAERRQPRYHVILWNDDDHSYDYVIRMMQELFGHPSTRGYELAKEVDSSGRAICLTTTREHAELKRDQVHAFGRDRLIAHCQGGMSCTIEPER